MASKQSFLQNLTHNFGRKTVAHAPKRWRLPLRGMLALMLLAGIGFGGWQGYAFLSSIQWSQHLGWANPSRWLDNVSGRSESARATTGLGVGVRKDSNGTTPAVVKTDTYWTKGAAFGDGKVKKPPTPAEKRKLVAKEKAFRKLPVTEKRKAWQGKLAEIRKDAGKQSSVQTVASKAKHNSPKGKAIHGASSGKSGKDGAARKTKQGDAKKSKSTK